MTLRRPLARFLDRLDATNHPRQDDPTTSTRATTSCNLLGNDVRDGLVPDDRELLGRLAQDVSFFNARDYLGLELGRLGQDVRRAA